jgi:glycogen debranching enzyme
LELQVAADFADLFEVRGSHRERRGVVHAPRMSANQLVLSYTGLDAVRRVTVVGFDPAPHELRADNALFALNLPPQDGCALYIEVRFTEVDSDQNRARRFRAALRHARHALRQSSLRMASAATSNEIFNEIARRAVADVRMLVTDKPEGPYPYAGIPWFSTVFGRDALITALQLLWMDPELARGVLRFLAAHQASREDPMADAEPGKILHEMRHGEMAALGEVPFRCYYGSVDSTPLFVLLAGAYLERSGDLDTLRSIWPNIRAALEWIERYGAGTVMGLSNTGAALSRDSLTKVGRTAMTRFSMPMGSWRRGPSRSSRCRPMCMRQSAAPPIWPAPSASRPTAPPSTERRSGFALISKRISGARSWALTRWRWTVTSARAGCAPPMRGTRCWGGIAEPERARRVAASLLSSAFFCGWGIRTLALGEARYNPMSYHNGSVWPHDNALIALGFARYGLRAQTLRIFDGLFAAMRLSRSEGRC